MVSVAVGDVVNSADVVYGDASGDSQVHLVSMI